MMQVSRSAGHVWPGRQVEVYEYYPTEEPPSRLAAGPPGSFCKQMENRGELKIWCVEDGNKIGISIENGKVGITD
ncbi:hypothetical protein AVEN_129846-1 [Araneus ventricosus]|uniref:Uncharacterized protein n=1 Tax=Araneus ventricosus TaxID=182803 RepID=A0A4Y2RQB1_ARAVE|nr:hypothetical protein AVEN_129846-1 [Araneus ventricosus]